MHTEIFHIPCKINLFLHIVGRREDGYHLLNSIFYPLQNPFDTLEISINKQEKDFFIDIACSTKEDFINIEKIDKKNNTLTKAYTLFYEKTGFCVPINIKLNKGIAHGAGLGGGSADAAALLKYLFKLYKGIAFNNASKEEKEFLFEIAVQVGADVPFFLEDTAMFVSGIGEELEKVNIKKEYSFFKNKYLLLLCPHIQVNTVWAFKEFRNKNQTLEKKFKKSSQINLTKVNKKDIHLFNARKWAQEHYRNDLEDCVFAFYPLLKEYKEKLYDFQASLALMSGSGSSIFALFESKQEAQEAEKYFSELKAVTTYPCVKL